MNQKEILEFVIEQLKDEFTSKKKLRIIYTYYKCPELGSHYNDCSLIELKEFECKIYYSLTEDIFLFEGADPEFGFSNFTCFKFDGSFLPIGLINEMKTVAKGKIGRTIKLNPVGTDANFKLLG